MLKRIIILTILIVHLPLQAQWFYFGRNKVQYYDFHWKIMKTPHFDIYYYPEMEKMAEIGAQYAENSFSVLERKFEFTVNKRIPLIFYATHQHFQQSNISPGFIPEGVGGFFEFIKGRVVIPANGDLNQFQKVIQHELVHVFTFFKSYIENKEHSRGQKVFPPLWLVEGLAEYWSSEWDATGDMIMKDAVLHNYLVPLQHMTQIYGTFMMYKEGEAICRYIAARYGEEKIFQLLDNIWKYDSFEDVFKEVLGVDFANFDKEWLYYLKKKYYPQIAENDMSYFVDPTLVKTGFNMKPAFYKNSVDSFVIYYSNQSGYSEITLSPIRSLRNNQKEKRETVIKGERNTKFEAFHLFNSGLDVNRGGIMAFAVKSGESDKLYLIDMNTKKIVAQKRWSGLISILSPTITEDSSLVAFNGISFGGQSDLYVWNRKTDHLIQLTNDIFLDKQPDFSPDGQWLVFVSDRTELGKKWAQDLYAIHIKSGEMLKLTSGKNRVRSPKWMPDGNRVAFIYDQNNQFNIWTVILPDNWRQSTVAIKDLHYYQLSKFLNGIWDLAITDGGNIIYSVFENRQFQFRLMRPIFNLDNERPQEVMYTKQKNSLNEPVWSPVAINQVMNVKKIAYKSKYQLDFAQTQVSQDPFWGTQGGGFLMFSDLLSNQYINIMLYKDPRIYGNFFKSLSAAVTYINLRHRINYAISAYRLAGRYYNYKEGYFYEDRTGISLAFSYPLSHFSRIEWSMNMDYSDKQIFGERSRIAYKHSQYISFINDNTLYYITGPLDGHRLNITFGHTMDVRYSNVNYFTYLMDYRQYFRLTKSSALAFRGLILGNEGKETRWFYLGGSWDLRGYRQWSLRGDKIFLLSSELRFPFFDIVYFKFPFLGIRFPRIRGAVFVDAGNAWNNKLHGIKGSYGIGWRYNLGGAIVFRFDMGKKTDFNTSSKKLFTQLFFGWDF